MSTHMKHYKIWLALALALLACPALATPTSTYYIYDEAGRVIGEYDDNGNPIAQHIYLDDRPVGVVQNGQLDYVVTDQQNTPRAITDTQQNVVWSWNSDPFGNGQPTGSLTYNLRFAGQFYDAETGNHYNYARDYSPAMGRYTQSDPLGLAGGINSYVYGNNNPTRFIDPYGYCPGGDPIPPPAQPNPDNDKPEDPALIPGTPQFIKRCLSQYLTGNYGDYLGNYIIPDNSAQSFFQDPHTPPDSGYGSTLSTLMKKAGNALWGSNSDVGGGLETAGKAGSDISIIYTGSTIVMATIAQMLANAACGVTSP